MPEAEHYLVLAAIIFTLGALGIVIRRNVLVLFMCIELMLNAANLAFVTFSKMHGNLQGQVAVLFIILIAAAEAAVGLAIIIAVFRSFKSVDSTDISELRY